MPGENRPADVTRAVVFRSPDGLQLSGTFVTPTATPTSVTVLVHGGGVTRDEGGFFTRLAEGMAANGIASLRFDLRGHGESEGRQEDLTISGILSDIQAAVAHAKALAGVAQGEPFGRELWWWYLRLLRSSALARTLEARVNQSADQLQEAVHRRQAVLD